MGSLPVEAGTTIKQMDAFEDSESQPNVHKRVRSPRAVSSEQSDKDARRASQGRQQTQATLHNGRSNSLPGFPPRTQPLLHHIAMHPPTAFASLLLLTLTVTTTTVSALGLNCRGSALCSLARFENKNPESILQVLRDAIHATSKSPTTTTYAEGEHIVCVSSSESITLGSDFSNGVDASGASESSGGNYKLDVAVGTGGVCAFPNHLRPGANLTLAQIRPLADQVLEHGCKTCGSATVDWGNSPEGGYLTFNYVGDPFCDGECISGDGSAVADSK